MSPEFVCWVVWCQVGPLGVMRSGWGPCDGTSVLRRSSLEGTYEGTVRGQHLQTRMRDRTPAWPEP